MILNVTLGCADASEAIPQPCPWSVLQASPFSLAEIIVSTKSTLASIHAVSMHTEQQIRTG